MIENEVMNYNEHGRLVVKKAVAERYAEIQELKAKLEEEEQFIRTNVLDQMQANNSDSCEVEGVKFSQIIPKDKETDEEEIQNLSLTAWLRFW